MSEATPGVETPFVGDMGKRWGLIPWVFTRAPSPGSLLIPPFFVLLSRCGMTDCYCRNLFGVSDICEPSGIQFWNSPCGFSSSVCLQLSLERCQPSPCSDPACVEILTHALITSRPRYCNSPLAASVNLCYINSPECCLQQAASFLGPGSRSGRPLAPGWSLVCSPCDPLCRYVSVVPGSLCCHLLPSASQPAQSASLSFLLADTLNFLIVFLYPLGMFLHFFKAT